jgi:Fe-S-cluster containining protein
MIAIDQTLISEDLFDQKFVCDLSACKGACCVEGESGAPLEEEELEILDRIFDQVKPYMRKEGLESIEKHGLYEVDRDGDYVTPLVNGKECAYVQFTENGTALCSIEQAHRDGKVDWQKPISCHLYPVRINVLKDYDALNYHKWGICSPACACGSKMDVPVYKFTRTALIRKYGQEWYEKLEVAHKLWVEMNTSK